MERSAVQVLAKRGLSQRQIAKQLGHSRVTIARALTEPVDKRPARRRRTSIVDPYRVQIEGWLRQGLSIVRMVELARADPERPYTGSRAVFGDHVRRIRLEQERAETDVPVRFEGLPAEYLQVDWGEIARFPFTQRPAGKRYFLCLASTRKPTALRVVLLAGAPLASDLAALPHLMRPPLDPRAPMAAEVLGGLLEELRCRQADGDTATGELVVFAIVEPADVDGPALRELARDGGRHGIYALLATADPSALDPALLAACPGRLETGARAAEEDAATAGKDGREAVMPGRGRWRLVGEAPLPVRPLRIDPADRAALLAAMAAARPDPDPDPTDTLQPAPLPDGANGHGGHVGGNGHGSVLSAAEHATAELTIHATSSNGHHPGEAAVPDHPDAAESVSAPAHAGAAATGEPREDSEADGATSDISSDTQMPTTPVAEAASGAAPGSGTISLARADGEVATEAGVGAGRAERADLPAGGQFGPRPGQLQLRLFGVPRLYDATGRVVDFGRGQMGLRLLTFLALQGEAGAAADSIFEHIWPLAATEADDSIGSTAAEKVRQAFKRARPTFARLLPTAVPAVIFRGSLYRLNSAAIWADTVAFAACLKEARRRTSDEAILPLLREALGYYAAPLAVEAPTNWFDVVWLDQERAHVQEEGRKVALWAIAALARRAEYAAAAAPFRQLRALAVVDDEIAQLELITQALRGERPLIAQSFDEHVAALSQLGMRPWQATRTLYEQLMTRPVTIEQRERLALAGRR
ncbi:MAG: helix-turn-helix domain-containing protein [Chloroflexi bacterium]|nr:helix-turn-helix domain-containing protein [Chloroflexota bacterium]